MVIEADGPPCPGNCPGRGCLEAFVSGAALGREGRRVAEEARVGARARRWRAGRRITGALVTELAHDGDEVGRAALIAAMGRRLGVGLTSFVNIFNPEVIVVGGGAIAAGDLLLEPARARSCAERALPVPRDAVRIVPARFGAESGCSAPPRWPSTGWPTRGALRPPAAWSSARRRSATSRTSRCGC